MLVDGDPRPALGTLGTQGGVLSDETSGIIQRHKSFRR